MLKSAPDRRLPQSADDATSRQCLADTRVTSVAYITRGSNNA